jgi:hypothetical protein
MQKECQLANVEFTSAKIILSLEEARGLLNICLPGRKQAGLFLGKI